MDLNRDYDEKLSVCKLIGMTIGITRLLNTTDTLFDCLSFKKDYVLFFFEVI